MSNELIISLIVNCIISVCSIVGNIIVAHITKTQDLASIHKYNKYLPKLAIQRKDPNWILDAVEKHPYVIDNYCRRTRRYIIIRYKQLLKQTKKDFKSYK